jgi:hypothetical protein
MGDKNKFVDELLDSALAQQRAEEPRAGLEARILGHVCAAAGEREARTKVWKLWIAAAATAVVVTFVAIYVANRSHRPAVETSRAVNTVPSTSPKEILTANSGATPNARAAPSVHEPKLTARRERKPLRHIEAHHWPAQFPTPAPLTEEQRALVQYVRETPRQVLAEPILKAELTVQHVEIKPLEIPPLEIQ